MNKQKSGTFASLFGETLSCILVALAVSALGHAEASAKVADIVGSNSASAKTEKVLHTFTGSPDGALPNTSLVVDRTDDFYGATYQGGQGNGAVFELSPNGIGGYKETLIYSFTGGADGGDPNSSSVIFDSAGSLYGTTQVGGTNGQGVVFQLKPTGGGWTESVLYNLPFNTYGGFATANLAFDRSGNLYGIIGNWSNGTNGEVFELSLSGGIWDEQTIYSFGDYSGNALGLAVDANGDIFGDTTDAIFELTPNGKGGWTPTTIHNLVGGPKDGYSPEGGLFLDNAGNLYGTTYYGGAQNLGVVWELSPSGNGKWTEKILHSFNGKSGSYPFSGIVIDSDGKIYGTTSAGGQYGGGTLYRLAPSRISGGTLVYREKTLWNFGGKDGSLPISTPLLIKRGHLYGTTYLGGSSSNGVAYEFIP